MPVELQSDFGTSNRFRSAGGQPKKIVITQELVMAIADRIYALLIHEVKIERERGRSFIDFHSKRGGF